jgi:hypothetical protein
MVRCIDSEYILFHHILKTMKFEHVYYCACAKCTIMITTLCIKCTIMITTLCVKCTIMITALCVKCTIMITTLCVKCTIYTWSSSRAPLL